MPVAEQLEQGRAACARGAWSAASHPTVLSGRVHGEFPLYNEGRAARFVFAVRTRSPRC